MNGTGRVLIDGSGGGGGGGRDVEGMSQKVVLSFHTFF